MTFDPTISLSSLISFAGVLVALWALLARQKALHQDNIRRQAAQHAENVERFTAVETKVDAMWAWFARQMKQINGREEE